MSLWAIVPVKSFRDGKSRLTGTLNDSDRFRLIINLLENTLKILLASEFIERVVVVSKDDQALLSASQCGATPLKEVAGLDLNSAITYGVQFAASQSVDSVLIIPADLPLLRLEDLNALICGADPAPCVAIAPDRHQDGTNALLVSPPAAIHFQYGPGSFQKHIDQSKQRGMKVQIVHSWSFELDLDLPDDLETFKRIEENGR